MPIAYLFWSSKIREISRRRLIRDWARFFKGSSSKSAPAFASSFSSSTRSDSSLLMAFSALRVIWHWMTLMWGFSWLRKNGLRWVTPMKRSANFSYFAFLLNWIRLTSSFWRTSASPDCMIGASLPSPSIICSIYDVIFQIESLQRKLATASFHVSDYARLFFVSLLLFENLFSYLGIMIFPNMNCGVYFKYFL